jgi:hypothetical protein
MINFFFKLWNFIYRYFALPKQLAKLDPPVVETYRLPGAQASVPDEVKEVKINLPSPFRKKLMEVVIENECFVEEIIISDEHWAASFSLLESCIVVGFDGCLKSRKEYLYIFDTDFRDFMEKSLNIKHRHTMNVIWKSKIVPKLLAYLKDMGLDVKLNHDQDMIKVDVIRLKNDACADALKLKCLL